MGIKNRFTAAIQGFLTANNGVDSESLKLSREFLRRGNKSPMIQDWSQVLMSDQDLYTGYSFAAINNRATAVAELAMENLKTDAKQSILDANRKVNKITTHPYIDLIDISNDFADYFFWYTVPTYLDLKGVYYLLAVRTVAEAAGSIRVGNIQEFKMLNPYEVRRVRNEKTLEVGGYVEVRDGMIREIPPQMIIEIRRLNPFSRDDPFALSDAVKDSQFTLKQAGDYTRHSLKNNMAAPGIISTDVKLDEQQFKNFVARVTNQEKGLPLFGDGAGSITWDSMQIDMDKAALDKINEINRSIMFAASGVGKTMMAIEESGTTRETAKVARDNFIRQHGIPLLRWIVDALNQDYKKYYKKAYDSNGYKMFIDSPLGVDRDAEIKDIQIRKESYEVYNTLVSKGFDRELAAKYANGEIGLDELGEPTNEPVSTVTTLLPSAQDDQGDQEDAQEDATNSLDINKRSKGKRGPKGDGSGTDKGYNPYRDSKGKFASGPGGFNPKGKRVDPVVANKYIDKYYRDSRFTANEQGSIHNYTGSQFVSVNHHLRTGQRYDKDSQLGKDIDNLKSVTMKNALKEDTTLFRAASMNRQFHTGDVFTDKGFASTSLSKDVPERMIENSSGSHNILQITASRGTNGIFPRSAGVNNPEAEFILHDNTTYRVNKVSAKEDYTLVEVDLL